MTSPTGQAWENSIRPTHLQPVRDPGRGREREPPRFRRAVHGGAAAAAGRLETAELVAQPPPQLEPQAVVWVAGAASGGARERWPVPGGVVVIRAPPSSRGIVVISRGRRSGLWMMSKLWSWTSI